MANAVPTPPMPPPSPPDALRLVLFGAPRAGKSSLLGALGQASQAQGHLLNGTLDDPTGGLNGLRHQVYTGGPDPSPTEVVPYPVSFTPVTGDRQDAVLIDCDGKAANALLAHEHPPDERAGGLARELLRADAVLLLVNAADNRLEQVFKEFGRFLERYEEGRGHRADVGGLPVFLVLTQCDRLADPGDDLSDWLEDIEDRKREVNRRFAAFRKRQDATGPFGHVDLHLWATAVKRPPLDKTPARPDDPYGVAELFRQVLEAAAEHRDRARAADRRLRWTVGSAAALLLTLSGLAVGLALLPREGPVSALQQKVEWYRAVEGSHEDRLQGTIPTLRTRLDRLKEVRDDLEFADLPASLKVYVRDRVEELTAYLSYYEKVVETPLPTLVRTPAELQAARTSLEELAPPRDGWTETGAAKVRTDRLADLEALQIAADEAGRVYRERAAHARDLWAFAGYKTPGGITWRAWLAGVRDREDEVRDQYNPDKTPFPEDQPIPGSPSGLTYAAALKFEPVADARGEWEGWVRKLAQVRDVASALGLSPEDDPKRPRVLVIPEGVTLAEAFLRLEQLRKAYPGYKDRFTQADLPDAVREPVAAAARVSYDYLLAPGQAAVKTRMEADAASERWPKVRTWLNKPEELAAWRELAVLLARLANPKAPDPVADLAAFLDKESFTIDPTELVLRIPERLGIEPARDAAFTVYQGKEAVLVFAPQGRKRLDQERVWEYTFRPKESKAIRYTPGEALSAELAVNDGNVLTWTGGRTRQYAFEALSRPPLRHRVGTDAETGRAQSDVKLEAVGGGIPAVPDLLPSLSRK